MSCTSEKSRIAIIGGGDVESRIPLLQMLSDKFSFSVYGSDKQQVKKFQDAGIDFHYYPMKRGINPIANVFMLFSLIKVLAGKNYDIVHTFDTIPSVWGRMAARLVHVPILVGTLPGLGSLYSGNNFRTRLVRGIYQQLQKLTSFISDLTIFQNYEDAEQFIRDGVVHRNKTAIINGSGIQTKYYDPEKFTLEQRNRIRDNLGLDGSKTVVIMISRLIRSKGVIEFAKAANSIRKSNPKVIFFLVGTSDDESLDRLTQSELELIHESVTCLGARDDVIELLSISNICVLPTFYREGIPRVLLEAAAMGLPIVATNVPGCKEVVEQNKNGLLVPVQNVDALKQAIETLVDDPLMRSQFGEASRIIVVSCFDLSVIASQTSSLYNKLLEKKKINCH